MSTNTILIIEYENSAINNYTYVHRNIKQVFLHGKYMEKCYSLDTLWKSVIDLYFTKKNYSEHVAFFKSKYA